MWILVWPKFVRWLTRGMATAITIWPMVLLTNPGQRQDPKLIRHERIHLRQQIECLLIGFYVLYFGFYIYYRIKGMTHGEAYLQIPFEREAYAQDDTESYLKDRKLWAWCAYV